MSIRKKSKKRDVVLEVLRGTDTHPSAQWIYSEAKKIVPDLSLGTVYRNLNLFKEEGLVVSVGVVDGEERFDCVTEPHTHFVCSRCGSIIDVALDDGSGDEAELEARYDVRVESRSVVYRGTCSGCERKSVR